jgi:hypothetical protein
MRAYTIVVDESPDETLPGDTPPFSGVAIEGGSLEDCVEHGCEAIALHLTDLALARQQGWDSPEAATTGSEAVGSAGLTDEEAVDALRRARAALDTVEAELLTELVRRKDPESQVDLRRAHIALLRARSALTGADRNSWSTGPGPGQPACAGQIAHDPSRPSR